MDTNSISTAGINIQQAAKKASIARAQAQNPDPEFARNLLQEIYNSGQPQPANIPINAPAPSIESTAAIETSADPLKLTVYPEPQQQETAQQRSLSPYQQRQEKPFEVVNNDFFGSNSVDAIIDAINPLQQIPVVSTLYREMTGDTISTGARLAGGSLFGGPLGFALALVNEIVDSVTGKDIGGNLYAAATQKYKATENLT